MLLCNAVKGKIFTHDGEEVNGVKVYCRHFHAQRMCSEQLFSKQAIKVETRESIKNFTTYAKLRGAIYEFRPSRLCCSTFKKHAPSHVTPSESINSKNSGIFRECPQSLIR